MTITKLAKKLCAIKNQYSQSNATLYYFIICSNLKMYEGGDDDSDETKIIRKSRIVKVEDYE